MHCMYCMYFLIYTFSDIPLILEPSLWFLTLFCHFFASSSFFFLASSSREILEVSSASSVAYTTMVRNRKRVKSAPRVWSLCSVCAVCSRERVLACTLHLAKAEIVSLFFRLKKQSRLFSSISSFEDLYWTRIQVPQYGI